MTHCTAEAARPSSVSMDGNATFTMLKSRTTMNDATRMRANPRLRRRASEAAWCLPRIRERGWPGWDMAGVAGPAVGDSLTGTGVDIEPPFQYDTFRFLV